VDGGEEHLLRHYYAALASRIGPEAAARYALVRRVSQIKFWPQEWSRSGNSDLYCVSVSGVLCNSEGML
jgi:hypothetical protein